MRNTETGAAAMLTSHYADFDRDRILLPDDFLEEGVPGFHAEPETLFLELRHYQRVNKEELQATRVDSSA
jgi:hypothetical protein